MSESISQNHSSENPPAPNPVAALEAHFPSSILDKYAVTRELGQGAYGYVCAAKNKITGQEVAVKKITKIFEKDIFAKRALRELKLLKHFNNHENITCLLDMELADPENFNEMYAPALFLTLGRFLVQDLMEADLHQIIRSQQSLSEQHFQFFIYQICKGLKYIHSANVLHRDLKPGNLLVNADCELKICDFGLARGFSEVPDTTNGFMTEYVATRWYRAPEIMLSFKSYTKAIDVWSVGCIMAELLGGRPLFKGRDYVDQLNQILDVCGTPDDETLSRIGSERAIMYIQSLPFTPKKPWEGLFPDVSENALDLLDKFIQFDPASRISVEGALEHPWLDAYHEPEEEISHNRIFDFSFESISSIEEMKMVIAKEIHDFKISKISAPKVPPISLDNTATEAFSSAGMSSIQDQIMDLDEELRMKGIQ